MCGAVTVHVSRLLYDVAEDACAAVLLDAAEVAEHGQACAPRSIHLEFSRRLQILLDEITHALGVVSLRVLVRIELLHRLRAQLRARKSKELVLGCVMRIVSICSRQLLYNR